MKKTAFIDRFAATLLCVMALTSAVLSQTTEFTYQGKLSTLGLPAITNVDLRFRLFDGQTGGNQIGVTQTKTNVRPAVGVFTVQLDFTEAPFSGEDRWIEISVSPAGLNNFTTLTPRQKLTSAPYSVKSRNASLADDSLKLGGVAADQYVLTTDPRLDAIDPGNFVQNSSTPQPGANFNIGGTGSANVLNAATQFNLGGQRILSNAGVNNLFAGVGAGSVNTGVSNSFFGPEAGRANTTGHYNSFFGTWAGYSNTTGSSNSFFGNIAGWSNSTGDRNSFFGTSAGFANTTGSENAFVGQAAGFSNTTGFNNSFFGRGAGITNTTGNSNSFFGQASGESNTNGGSNSFFGNFAGQKNTTGSNNAFFGADAGRANTTGFQNSFFGTQAGLSNTTGSFNSVFGRSAGRSNTTGSSNSFFGQDAGLANTTGSGSAFVGFGAGKANTTGIRNSFYGVQAGVANSSGGSNTFVGAEAGFGNTTGAFNSFFGESAGAANTTGSNLTVIGAHANVGANNLAFATAIGAGAVVNSSNTLVLGRAADTVQIPGTFNISGTFGTTVVNAATQYNIGGNRILSNAGSANLFVGYNAGATNTGSQNTFVGPAAGANTTVGSDNSFFGTYAGLENRLGVSNSFFGTNAGRSSNGDENSFFGVNAGAANTSGGQNTFVGKQAGIGNSTGARNTFIGYHTGPSSSSVQVNNSTAIGYGARASTSNTIVLGTSAERTIVPGHFIMYGGDFGNAARTFDAGAGFTGLVAERLFWRRIGGFIPPSDIPACYNFVDLPGDRAAGLTYCFDSFGSSANKLEIKPFNGGLDIINRLNPVSYKRKEDGKSDVGLNADDVAEVAPQLVTRDDKGEAEGVKNGSLDVLFINAIKEQQKQIEAQQKQIDALKRLVCQSTPQAEGCKEVQK